MEESRGRGVVKNLTASTLNAVFQGSQIGGIKKAQNGFYSDLPQTKCHVTECLEKNSAEIKRMNLVCYVMSLS